MKQPSRRDYIAQCNTFGLLLALSAAGCGGDARVSLSLDMHEASVQGEPADGGAMAPPSTPRRGDDAPQRVIEIGTLTSAVPPSECTAGLPPILPGCSLNDPRPQGLDCDGDGVIDHRVYNCELATAEQPGMFGGGFDCAPDDPGLRHWVWRDADGDGYGTGTWFCAGPEIPDGYIAAPEHGQDCDDDAAAVHPDAVDVWGDGFDMDCSGTDYPACRLLSPGQEPPRVLLSDACDGPDLYLSSIAACGDRCLNSGALWGFVGNAGRAPAPGPIVVQFRDDRGNTGSLQVTGEGLAPGGAAPLFNVPFSLVTEVEIWIETEDCGPDNDRYLFSHPNGDRICPF